MRLKGFSYQFNFLSSTFFELNTDITCRIPDVAFKNKIAKSTLLPLIGGD